MFRRRRAAAAGVLVAVVAIPIAALGGSGDGSRPAGAPTPDRDADAEAPELEGITDAPLVDKPPVELVAGFEDPVPILMYHVIAEAPPDAANPGLFVPPGELAAQVRWLAKRGFTAVTLGELFDAWEDGNEIPSRPVVLSFDDGTRDQHDIAAPILAAYDFPGVLNLKVESLNQSEMADPEIEEMLAEGWELASHTHSHPDLTTLDPGTLETEVRGSRKALQRRFGVPVDFFCYPAGAYDVTVAEAVEDAGYRGATTTEPGLAEPGRPYELARVRIDPGDGASGLRSKLEGAGVGI
jgi:peptidoglycan/xylan/chitin deacetylase (PgdA/CDA1 family)